MPSTIGIVASGEDVLNDAVFWVDAGLSSVVSGALSNLGTGGSALNAVFGNSTGVDSFDPALLAHTGTNYLYLPGVTGNYASSPDAAALDITGDIEIVVRVALDDWTPSTAQVLIGKRQTGQWSYQLTIDSTGQMSFNVTNDGSTAIINTSTAASFTDGATYWIKTTRLSSSGAASFWWAPDSVTEPVAWNALTTATGGASGSIFSGTAALEIGSSRTGLSAAAGKFYRAIVRNGIGGTTVFDADFTTGITSGAQTTFTESSANAATVTINRSTSGRKAVAVTRPILLFGTDDYLEVPDNDLLDFGAGDSFTALVVVRQWSTPILAAPFITKRDTAVSAGPYWMFQQNGTAYSMSVGMANGSTAQALGFAAPTWSSGVQSLVGFTRAANVITPYVGTTAGTPQTVTATGSLANSNPLRIGKHNGASNTQDMELVAAAVWRRALNANEIATIVARYT